jgi:hypothetical protein
MDKIFENKEKLIKEKYALLKKIFDIEKEINELDQVIINNCIHEWITEREDCLYGEKLTYCKKCGLHRGF